MDEEPIVIESVSYGPRYEYGFTFVEIPAWKWYLFRPWYRFQEWRAQRRWSGHQ